MKSRDIFELNTRLDFVRQYLTFQGSIGFYFSTALMLLSVKMYLFGLLLFTVAGFSAENLGNLGLVRALPKKKKKNPPEGALSNKSRFFIFLDPGGHTLTFFSCFSDLFGSFFVPSRKLQSGPAAVGGVCRGRILVSSASDIRFPNESCILIATSTSAPPFFFP